MSYFIAAKRIFFAAKLLKIGLIFCRGEGKRHKKVNDFYIFPPGHLATCNKQLLTVSVFGYGGVVNIDYFNAGIEAKVASFLA